MINIRVNFENGDYLYTKFNGTIIQAQEYYIGKTFVFGVEEDKAVADSVTLVTVIGGHNV